MVAKKKAKKKRAKKTRKLTAPKRTQGQIQSDRAFIARLYCEAKPLWMITESVNKRAEEQGYSYSLTYQAIQFDLKAIRKVWEDQQSTWFTKYVNEQLARLDHLESTLWHEFYESKREKTTTVVKGKGKKKKGGKPSHVETIVKKENKCGDPRYLEGVVRCIEMRHKLLKPEADTKDEEWAQRKVVLFQQTVDLMAETVPRGSYGLMMAPEQGGGGNGKIIDVDSVPTPEKDGGDGRAEDGSGGDGQDCES